MLFGLGFLAREFLWGFWCGKFLGFLLREVFGEVKGFWRLGVFGVFVIFKL
jgi:hypothetical protein